MKILEIFGVMGKKDREQQAVKDTNYRKSVELAFDEANKLIETYNLPKEFDGVWGKISTILSPVEKRLFGDVECDSVAILEVPAEIFPKLFKESDQEYIFETSAYPADNSGGYEPQYLWFVTPKKLRIKTVVEIDDKFFREIVYPSSQVQTGKLAQELGDGNYFKEGPELAKKLGFRIYDSIQMTYVRRIKTLPPEIAKEHQDDLVVFMSGSKTKKGE